MHALDALCDERNHIRSIATRHEQGRGLLHEVHDQLEIVRPITKWAKRILEVDQVAPSVHEAFRQLRSVPARPVEIEIPLETFAESAEVEIGKPIRPEPGAGDPERLPSFQDRLEGECVPGGAGHADQRKKWPRSV